MKVAEYIELNGWLWWVVLVVMVVWSRWCGGQRGGWKEEERKKEVAGNGRKSDALLFVWESGPLGVADSAGAWGRKKP